MNSIKQAFNHSFEQVSTSDHEPEFAIHGIGYRGKWGRDTMSIFLKDLEELASGLTDTQTESVSSLESKIESLNSTIDDLNDEISTLESENNTLEGRIGELEEENGDLIQGNQTLQEEVESLRIANTAMAGNLSDADSRITALQVAVSNLTEANNKLEDNVTDMTETILQLEEQAQR